MATPRSIPVPADQTLATGRTPTGRTHARATRAGDTSAGSEVGLRDLAADRIAIGTAVTAVAGAGRDTAAMPLVGDHRHQHVLAREFSSLTAENQMKWEWLRPAEDEFDFAAADAIVDFAEANDQQVRGHTLLWHNQNPDWLTSGGYGAEELRQLLRTHIHTVVGRYAGRIGHWDVVNEIFDDDGRLRMEQNPWLRSLGPGIIAEAFAWAHEDDPTALLFGNDYAVEGIGPKSDAWDELLQGLVADGVPVHGFGVQAHLDMSEPFPDDLWGNLRRFTESGLRTAITELDIRGPLQLASRPAGADLSGEYLAEQADWYGRILRTALATPGCESVTVWGVLDEHSWVPDWFPGTGEPLLMQGDYTPKPAYFALSDALANPSHRGLDGPL